MKKFPLDMLAPDHFVGARPAGGARPARGATLLLAAPMLLLLACGAGVDADSGAPPSGGGCVPGELTLPDGRCQPAGLPPSMACAPGELALADGRCQPAGVPAEACAAGFAADDRGGCSAVLPEGACRTGTVALPGERECREIAPCGEGTWGDIPVDAMTQFVDRSYAGDDSDGSREKPWTTVGAGVRAAAASAIVAVAEGTYRENVVVSGKPVRIWGRCPALTRLVGVEPSAALEIARPGATGSEVRSLAVTGPGLGITVLGARSATLDGVWVHDAGFYGVAIADLATVALRGTLVERSREAGIVAIGAEATIESTVVRDTQPDDAGEQGYGIAVQSDLASGDRAKLSLSGSLVEQNREIGVYVAGSEATIEATVVRDTLLGGAGAGVLVRDDPAPAGRGKLSLSSSLIERNHDKGVFVASAEAAVEATVVRDTQPDDEGELGWGIFTTTSDASDERGKLVLSSSLVEKNREVGVFVMGADAEIGATAVRDTQLDRLGELGYGIAVSDDEVVNVRGSLVLSASLIERNYEAGVYVLGADATIDATVARDTQPNRPGRGGRGINVQSHTETGEPARLVLSASLIERNHDIGVFAVGATVTIQGTIARDTRPSPAGLELGDGILVLADGDQSSADITGTLAADNARAGVLYVSSGGVLSGVRSSGNRFGLVLQSGETGARPTVGDGNLFEGNTDRDQVSDGDLPVPDTAPPLP